jgi:cytochrome c5
MFKRTLAIALLGSQFIAPLSLAEEDRSAVLDNIKPVGSVRVVGQSVPVVVEAAPAEAAPAEAAPVAEAAPAVEAAAPVVAEAAPAAVDGNAVYMKACFACHGTGAAGAPKLGDKAAWAPRIATGMDALLHSALNGKGAMPPKGGQMQLTEAEIRAGIEHMVSAAQ